MNILIKLLFLLLTCINCINCISNSVLYNHMIFDKQLNILVLKPNFDNEKINTTEKITNKITYHYQHYIDNDQFDSYFKNNSINSIITYSDFVTCKKNELMQKYFNRSNISLNKCYHLNDKKSLRNYLSKFKTINQVSSITINNNKNLIDSIKNIQFDNFIVKPIIGAGSGGIFNLYRKNNTLYGLDKFIKEYDDNQYIKLSNKFIVEEFIGGTEHNLDIVIYNNKVYFWHISDDLIDMVYFQDTGSELPTRLNEKQSLEMYNQVKLILKYLKIKNGVYHFEFKLYNNNAYLIELNPRVPGGNYVEYIEKLYGSNLLYDNILISLNKEPYYNNNFLNYKKPNKQICDREYYAHILDSNSIGSILLNNDYYLKKFNDIKNVNVEFEKGNYNIIRSGNEYTNMIYNINTNKIKNACNFLENLEKPNYVSIYKLPNDITINKNDIIEVINGTIETVKRLNTKEILNISKFISYNNIVYLYTDNNYCSNKLYNCLYIPDLTDIINKYNYTYQNKLYKIPVEKLGKVNNQIYSGPCQIFATINALEMIHNNTIKFSESALYYTSRFAKLGGLLYNEYLNAGNKVNTLNDYSTDNFNSGMYNKFILDVISYYGTCLEKIEPYNISKFNDISQECIHTGINYKTKDYHIINNPYDNRDLVIDEIKYFINNNVPVVFGITVFDPLWTEDNFMKNGQLELPSKCDNSVSGHAMLLVGYDDDRRIFWFKNSWGLDFGINMYSEKKENNNNGYGYLSYDYLYTEILDSTSIDNKYLIDGFMVVLSQYNHTKLNHINSNIKVLYNSDYDDNLNIKFESTKEFFLNQFKQNYIKYKHIDPIITH